MRRALLILAMLLSLWPIAFLAVSLASDNSTISQQSDSSAPADASGAATSQLEARAKALDKRVRSLLNDFHASPSLKGVRDPTLSRQAGRLAQALSNWQASNDNEQLRQLTFGQQRVVNAVAAFAHAPTQAKLDRFTASVDDYNKLVDRTP